MARREEQVWAEVAQELARRSGASYDHAVNALADLRDLAVHRGQRAAFDEWLQQVVAPYSGSTVLQRWLRERKLG